MDNELDWEQKRKYLVHSLFQDAPASSFIPKDDSPSSVLLEPCSPLPPLEIEIIPKPNPHDEPEEFYRDLEVKMKKFYRKIFYKEKFSPEDDVHDLTYYMDGYDLSDNDVVDDIEKEKQAFDADVRRKAIVLEDENNDNYNNQIIETRNDEEVTQDEIVVSKDISEDSSEYSVEFRPITCVAEVHREDTDTDEAIVHEEAKKSPILECTLRSQVPAARDKTIDEKELHLDDDLGGDGDNRRSIREVRNLDTISHNDSSDESIDIMRSQNVRRHSMGSLHLPGLSTSSSTHVDLQHSSSLDPGLDLFQVSTLGDSTKMEAISQDDQSKSLLKQLSDPILNNSINQNDDDDEDNIRANESTDYLPKGFNRITSTPKSKASAIRSTLSLEQSENESAFKDDENFVIKSEPDMDVEEVPNDEATSTGYLERYNESTDDEYNPFEDATISYLNTSVKEIPDNKATTENSKRNNTSTEDTHDNTEVITMSNSKPEVKKISKDKSTIAEDSNEKIEEDTVSYDKYVDKTKRKLRRPATLTPKSRTSITPSVLDEDSTNDQLNTARMSWSTNETGTKRPHQKKSFSKKSKKRKLNQQPTHSSPTSNLKPDHKKIWDTLSGIFFVGVPICSNLCNCPHHFKG